MESINELAICQICFEKYSLVNQKAQPRLLPCLQHSTCTKCLEGMMAKTPDKLICPFDNLVFNTSLSKIPKNRFIIQYLEMTHSEQPSARTSSASSLKTNRTQPSAPSQNETEGGLSAPSDDAKMSAQESHEEAPEEDYFDDDYGDSLAYENVYHPRSSEDRGAFSTRFFDSFPSTPRRSSSSMETSSNSAQTRSTNSGTPTASNRSTLASLFKKRTLTALNIQHGKLKSFIDNILSDPEPESSREVHIELPPARNPQPTPARETNTTRASPPGDQPTITTFLKTRAMNKLNAQQEKFRSFFDNYVSEQRNTTTSYQNDDPDNIEPIYPDLEDVGKK